MRALRLGVLISGRGSNLGALIEATKAVTFPAEISVVVASNRAARGLGFAAEAGIPAVVLEPPRRTLGEAASHAYETALDRVLRDHEVGLVCLAGFMRLLGAAFVESWHDRLINIHPSLLPAFKGLHVHERVLEAGVRITGCTVHFVRAQMDDGPILVQAAVPVLPDDDRDRLAARVLAAEHLVYPRAVALIAFGRVRVIGERAVIDTALDPQLGWARLISPADVTV